MSSIFSCREAARLASEALEHPLPARQRVALRVHTMMCSACRSYARQITLIDRIFRLRAQRGDPTIPTRAGLDAAARERILTRLTCANR